MAVTLDQLLDARDNRRARQLELIGKYPGRTLVVLTVNIPGSEKRTDDSLIVGREGVKAIEQSYDVQCELVLDLNTGFEAYLLTPLSGQEAKTLAMGIESNHPLGRLMDIDVFNPDGTPISRSDCSEGSRGCLICGNDARICMRTFAHSQTELHNKIHSLVNDFLYRH